jgi:DNA-3-methyladenine glycosylase
MPLPREFYARDTVAVARGLLGMRLVHGRTAGLIVEVEAYLGLEDKAAHASRGITPRTRVIFGPPGHAYVYLIYGMHECLNVIAEPEGTPGCVLIRALQPVDGIPLMHRRRQGQSDLAGGPGKLTQAMGISRRQNGTDLTRGPLLVEDSGMRPGRIEVTPRIGIRHCADWPLRFVASGLEPQD